MKYFTVFKYVLAIMWTVNSIVTIINIVQKFNNNIIDILITYAMTFVFSAFVAFGLNRIINAIKKYDK